MKACNARRERFSNVGPADADRRAAAPYDGTVLAGQSRLALPSAESLMPMQ
ncbi:hypothetical protein BN2476_700001 [Paraburkholderia piptadeniae]|uniref:Uncharacterized protein n=1 Tax=Paraburkholderia piptadeniae TaxID=1701573 RepID=A0A1N7SQ86_9BURK|nr:hypothetical protein BN2476_700001 [Paraburkholderia piptadeniae]